MGRVEEESGSDLAIPFHEVNGTIEPLGLSCHEAFAELGLRSVEETTGSARVSR
jgi:hypothetical protein